MEKISVIVAIYNVESYLEKCLTSIDNQTYSNYEVILVNDGSSDKSQSIIDQFVLKNPEKFKGYIKENGGLSDARNFGLTKISGKYLIFVDGDDFLEPDLLLKCYDKMTKDDLDFVVFSYYQYYLKDSHKEIINFKFSENKIYSLVKDKELLAYMPNSAWNKMYKSDLFLKNNLKYPYGLRHQDLDVATKLSFFAGRVGYLNIPLYNYIIDRSDNITSKVDTKVTDIIKIANNILDFYKQNDIFNTCINELNFLIKINCSQSLKKAIKMNDRKFVFNFIDDIFNIYQNNFKNVKDNYGIKQEVSSSIYLNKILLKLYYIYYHSIRGR